MKDTPSAVIGKPRPAMLGKLGEEAAAAYLMEQGFTILGRNVRLHIEPISAISCYARQKKYHKLSGKIPQDFTGKGSALSGKSASNGSISSDSAGKGPGRITAEIDIIARDGDMLVFAEVKTRSSKSCGFPSESVDISKQRKLRRAASQYMQMHGLHISARFDVISVLGTPGNFTITHYKNAFY